MGFAKPSVQRVNLRDFESRIVALKFVSDETGIRVNLPADPTTGDPGGPAEREATVAAIATPEQGVLGESLVFYPVVRDTVRRHAPDWVIGILERLEGEQYAYFALSELDDEDHAKAVQVLTSKGLS